jgi:hypothetical protein
VTALVDDSFRVFAAARQGDLDRVGTLLAAMDETDLFNLSRVLQKLRVPVAAELVVRVSEAAAPGESGWLAHDQ